MVETIIYLTISFLVSLIFIILGWKQYHAKTPVTMNTSIKPPRPEELTSVEEWNHRHGRNFIILGCLLFLTMALFVYFLELFDSIALQCIIFLAAIFLEIDWVVLQHNKMKKELMK